jgi:hypothetical protein
MSLKERYIIPKRKESQETLNHHHHRHHHHHSSKYPYEENNYRLNFSTRSSIIQQKPIERFPLKRSFIVRDIPRTQEQQLSKDERRKLFEQQYEDEEKVIFVCLFFKKNFFYFDFLFQGKSSGSSCRGKWRKSRLEFSSISISFV